MNDQYAILVIFYGGFLFGMTFCGVCLIWFLSSGRPFHRHNHGGYQPDHSLDPSDPPHGGTGESDDPGAEQALKAIDLRKRIEELEATARSWLEVGDVT